MLRTSDRSLPSGRDRRNRSRSRPGAAALDGAPRPAAQSRKGMPPLARRPARGDGSPPPGAVPAMSRFAAVALALALAAAPACAEEPHLDFVRGLQARGMADLAADYLQRLAADPPPGLKAVLPLELARARLEQAGQEGD